MSQASLIERFLGAYEPADGPFALLAITPNEAVEPRITAALERQLARIARHPQASTHEAEEVRLVLHVAAAQLRDPDVRSELAARWHARRGGVAPVVPTRPAEPARPPLPSPSVPAAPPRAMPATPSIPAAPARPVAAASGSALFRSVAQGVISQTGGWNADAKRRLERLASAYAVDPAEYQRITAELAGLGHAATDRAHAAAKPVSRQRRIILTGATLALFIASGVMTLSILRRFEVITAPSQQEQLRAIPKGTQVVLPQMPDAKQEAERPELVDHAVEDADAVTPVPNAQPAPVVPKELLARVRGAKGKITNDARTSLAEFESTISELSTQWGTLAPELLASVHNEVVDYVYDASRRDRGTGRAALECVLLRVERLASGVRVTTATEIMSSAWATGMLNRLRRDRDLPDNLSEAINTALRKVSVNGRLPVEQTNAQGIGMALLAMSDRLTPREADDATGNALVDAWGGWAKAVAAMGKVENASQARDVLMSALDHLLAQGLDPTMSRTTNEAIRLLLASADWSDGLGTGARAINWFDDVSQVTPADLSVVTGWMVGSSNLPGVSAEMILAPDATNARRMELRDSYASLFGLPASRESRAVAARWTTQAREMITVPGPMEMDEALVRTAALARMNESAAFRWRQDERASDAAREGARIDTIQSLVRSGTPSPSASVNAGVLTMPGDERDGLWARRYLASMNAVDTRVELLNELRNSGGPVGPGDADVLAEAACFGSPMQVRRLAQTIVRELSDNMLVVNATLEALPRAARQQGVSDVVESITGVKLPKVEESTWRLESRRALVNRLMELIAVGKDARFDALGDMLAASYRSRVDAFGAPTPGTRPDQAKDATEDPGSAAPETDAAEGPTSPGAEQPAGELWELWVSQGKKYAEGGWTFVGLDVLQRRRAGRASLADDPLQLFAAEQASGAEVMGYVVAAERPAKSQTVRNILDEMAAERRGAAHLFAQMEAAERAMLRLWIVRFGEEEKP